MTEIYFYSGAGNKLGTACQLCAKAVRQGIKVLIYSVDSTIINQLDRLLWTFSPTSFVAHCKINDDRERVRVAPVILSDKIDDTLHCDVLLNLDDICPPVFDQFQRLVEISGVAEEDKLAARKRYRFYQQEGYKIHHFKLDDKDCA